MFGDTAVAIHPKDERYKVFFNNIISYKDLRNIIINM